MTGPVAAEPDAPLSAEPTTPGRTMSAARLSMGVCPYLEVAGERWRHAGPSRDHRCTALVPPPPLTTDKQRRLCLGAAHVTCGTFLAAGEARASWSMGMGAPASEAPDGAERPAPRSGASNRWGIVRVAPVVALAAGSPSPLDLVRNRGMAQVALVALLGLAFVAIALSRLPGEGNSGALLVATPTPAITNALMATVAPTLAPTPTASAAPTVAPPPPTPPPPSATPASTVYRVVSGDTLSGIAGRFRTTVKAIMELNGLTSTTLRIGQQLLIPVPASVSQPPAGGAG